MLAGWLTACLTDQLMDRRWKDMQCIHKCCSCMTSCVYRNGTSRDGLTHLSSWSLWEYTLLNSAFIASHCFCSRVHWVRSCFLSVCSSPIYMWTNPTNKRDDCNWRHQYKTDWYCKIFPMLQCTIPYTVSTCTTTYSRGSSNKNSDIIHLKVFFSLLISLWSNALKDSA